MSIYALPKAGTTRYFRLRRTIRALFWGAVIIAEVGWITAMVCTRLDELA